MLRLSLPIKRAPTVFRRIAPSSTIFLRPSFRAMSGSNQTTISDAVIHDHRELEEYYEKYTNASDIKEKTEWANQFRWELARHSVGEELVLYPAMEKYMGEKGKKLADNDRADHLQCKKQLYELERTDISTPQYPTLFKELMDDLKTHMKSEEENDLIEFEKSVPEGESASMAASFSRTKMFVPTRSHPSAPDQGGPFETVAGLMAAPLDHLKDMFDAWPKKS